MFSALPDMVPPLDESEEDEDSSLDSLQTNFPVNHPPLSILS